jgi:sarcosine oxidase
MMPEPAGWNSAPMARGPEVAVIGAGIAGLCTAYALRERGAAVRVCESGVPGHGQSGGDSRVFRHAHDDLRLVGWARRSRALYTEWGERLGVEMVSPDGVLAIGPAVERRLAGLEGAGGFAARRIEPAEIAAHHPLLAPSAGPAMLDPEGGAIRARESIAALAAALGDALVADEVLAVAPTRRGTVEVRTGGERTEHARVVVCAGRGTAALARGAGIAVPVRLGAHVRVTFAVRGDPPERIACLQDGSGQFGEVGVYAAPVRGNRRYAVGLSQSVDVHPDGGLLDPESLAALADRACGYVARALPGLDPEPLEYRHCWVTDLPWHDDGVGVWEAGGILCLAGHNLFKQAPALGRALAAAALGDPLPAELHPEARLGAPRDGSHLAPAAATR